jgi:hypothetical protein
MIRTALALARRGLHVFPCLPCRKEPATAHGYLDATVDAGTIRQWWGERPDLNVAIATGAVSNLVAIDVDGAEAALAQLEAKHGALPPTVETITARGRHILLRHPGGIVPSSVGKIAAGIDVKADGGYIVAPPSLHPSGKRYCWSVDCAKEIAPAPGWLIEKIAASTNGTPLPAPPSVWRELVEHGVAEGARDKSAARLAGYLLRRSVDAFVTLELLQIWNASKCAPPLPAGDIERIVASIAKKELKRRGADSGR